MRSVTFVPPLQIFRSRAVPKFPHQFKYSNKKTIGSTGRQYRPTYLACTQSDESNKSNLDAYKQWVVDKQTYRHTTGTSSAFAAQSIVNERFDTSAPPKFDHSTLFLNGAEEYACDQTQKPSSDYIFIAEETDRAGLFAPCMVGAVEGQFLKMLTQIKAAKRVLDIGTFTGYSALAFADGLPENGQVVTIEADPEAASVARKAFAHAKNGDKIKLLEADARAMVDKMVQDGETFDIVFMDADKINYRQYYEAGLKLVPQDGIVIADNALGALLYEDDDPVKQSLHEFAQFVRADERVEQVMLTVREGILIVRKI